MNELIKEIEQAQLKEKVDDFNVGDTVKVHEIGRASCRERVSAGSKRETAKESRSLKVP